MTRGLAWAAVLAAGCSSRSSSPPTGHIIVALTIDWEGADLTPEGLDALDEVRKVVGPAPLTHFVSSAYFTKQSPDPTAAATIAEAVRPGDELAVHLHAWRSLAVASGVTARLSPSFLTGTDKITQFDDGDAGFETDPDVYTVPELRAMLRTSAALLAKVHPISRSFRAGGYLGTPKMLLAALDEGFSVDSSAIDYRQLADDLADTDVLPERVAQVWRNVTPGAQPFRVRVLDRELLEMPIAAVSDYATVNEIVQALDSAHARLHGDPHRDVFVVLGFHLETGADYASRVSAALTRARASRELADELVFTTVQDAADLAISNSP